MYLAIIPSAFILSFAAFYLKVSRDDDLPAWRRSFLYTVLLSGIFIAVTTEILSLFNMVTFGWILCLWILTAFLAAVIVCKLSKKAVISISRPKTPPFEVFMLACTASIAGVLCLIALVAPPNTYDSMTYHMSRVEHWIQNRSVAFYPTHILRQNHMNPWAEFAIMHLRILSGGDRFANLIQWFSMIGCLIGVSLIAYKLGAARRAQLFAAFITATIPMGVLQATSTQNDYVISFWVVSFVYFILLLKEDVRFRYIFAAGVSLGLAILTKATAYIFAFPFLVWLFFSAFRSARFRAWKILTIIAMTAVAINLGHYVRNYDLYKNPIGPREEVSDGKVYKYMNETFGISGLFSNVVRNIAGQLGTTDRRINSLIYRAISSLHGLLKIDINDPRTTWTDSKFTAVGKISTEGRVDNKVHFMLIILSLVYLLAEKSKKESKDLSAYAICLVSGFLLFSFILKWQPWHNRLLLPLFILWSPLMAVVLPQRLSGRMLFLASILLILPAIGCIFSNPHKPIKGINSIYKTERIAQYFVPARFKQPYVEAVELIKSRGCLKIGLVLGLDDFEYPLWVILKNELREKFRMEHVAVNNESTVKSRLPPFADFKPDAIISTQSGEAEEITLRGDVYVKAWSQKPLGIFIKHER